ncbi:MAG: efflux RND transporter periplasmic adaptor subunit [Candidatus Omnitrophota bacterium]|jgi:RND family efflux transporter MFP subunit|nr:MAG: efflux RND transporter periplasmic adaptor subunit [Candidatus Omnitrophota bacterium]
MDLIKNIVIVVVGLLVLLALLFWMQGSFTPGRVEPGLLSEKSHATENVVVVTAHYKEMDHTAEAVGSIQSKSTTNIASKILASILTVNVKPGDAVKKGDLLITLDDRDLNSRLEQSRNAVDAAKATLDKATRDRERYESLLKTQSITQNAYDDMVSAERIAKARLDQAQQQVREAEVMRSHAKIFATSNGVIIEKSCDPGDLASPGQSLLTMYDPGNLRVEVAVRERLAGRLKIGDQVRVMIDAISKEMTGTVEEIVPSADQASRSVLMKVGIPRESGIFPGMFGRISIPLEPVKFLVIPAKSVRKVGQLEMVTLKVDKKINTRAVRTGRQWNGDIEVLSGLNEGDEVVVPAAEA